MIPNLTIGDLQIDCADPERARDFYAALTGYEKIASPYGPSLKTPNGMTFSSRGLTSRTSRRFGRRSRAKSKSRCTWILRWTICAAP